MKGYATRKVRVYLPERDIERLRKRGWVMTTDLAPTSALAVFDLSGPTPIGFVTDTSHMHHVIKRVKTTNNPLVRLNDLMTATRLSHRTGRGKSTISGWLKYPDFPKPVRPGEWLWPDVRDWMAKHDLKVRRDAP